MTTIYPDELKWLNVTRAVAVRVVPIVGLVASLADQACTNEPRPTRPPGVSEWSVSTEPYSVVGREGDPHLEFHHIAGVATLRDGGLVVADGASDQLRVLSRSGEFIRVFGRSGDGPGEFRGLAGIMTSGDTILAFDRPFRAAARFQAFREVEGFVWGTTLRPRDGSPSATPAAILSSLALVVMRGGWRVVTPPPEGTIARDTVTLGVVQLGGAADSQVVRWLGEFPNNAWFSYQLPPGGPVQRSMGLYTLGPSLVVGTSGRRVWIGDTGTGIIKVFSSDGSPVMQMQFPLPPRTLDEAALQRARAAALARVTDPDIAGERARINALYSLELRPAMAPRFTRFTAGVDNEMWVECFSEMQTAEHCAVVLDPAGRLVGGATIPAGLELRAVDRDRIVGVHTDADGVQRIVMHRLTR